MSEMNSSAAPASPVPAASPAAPVVPAASAVVQAPAAAPAASAAEPVKPAAPVDGYAGELGGEDQKAQDGEGKPVQPPAAEIEIKIPEGFAVDTAMLDGYKGLAKELSGKPFDGAAAQRVVDWYAKATADSARSVMDQLETDWKGEIQKDATFGGKNLRQSMAYADAAVKKYGQPGMWDRMGEMHIRANPDIFRLLAAVGKADSEDTSAGPGGGGPAHPSRRQVLDAIYPTMNEDGTPKKKG